MKTSPTVSSTTPSSTSANHYGVRDATLATFLTLAAGGHEDHAVWWRIGTGPATGTPADEALHLFVPCSDFFFWGCSDFEAVTDENIADLATALDDARAAIAATDPDRIDAWTGDEGYLLFCARSRGSRPQGAYYPYLHSATWTLFDATGPVRDIDSGNPHAHPKERNLITGAEGRQRTSRPEIPNLPSPAPEGAGSLNLAQMRTLLETFCFDDTDAIRWLPAPTTDNEPRFYAYLVAFGSWGERAAEGALLRPAALADVCAEFAEHKRSYADAELWFDSLWVARERSMPVTAAYLIEHVEAAARHLFLAPSSGPCLVEGADLYSADELAAPTSLDALRAEMNES